MLNSYNPFLSLFDWGQLPCYNMIMLILTTQKHYAD